MLYANDGRHMLINDMDFKRAPVDSLGYKHIGGACDLTATSLDTLQEGHVIYGAGCVFPAGTRLGEGCKVGALCVFQGEAFFEANCELDSGCRFMPGTIFADGCKICGHEVISPSPLLIIEFPKVLFPVYFVNTLDGIMYYTRSSMEPFSEVSCPDMTMLFEGDMIRPRRVVEAMMRFVKEVYEQVETDKGGANEGQKAEGQEGPEEGLAKGLGPVS